MDGDLKDPGIGSSDRALVALLQQVTRNSPLPYHVQINQIIAGAITRGLLAPASRLPSERELAQLCGVSRPTVRLALDALAKKEWIEKVPGRGIFVGSPFLRRGVGCVLSSLNPGSRYQWPVLISQAIVEEAWQQGLKPEVYLLESKADHARLEANIESLQVHGVLSVGDLSALGLRVPAVHHSANAAGYLVDLDTHSLTYQGVTFLAEQERKRIALVHYGGDTRNSQDSVRGYRDALQACNLEHGAEQVVQGGAPEEAGAWAVRQLWASGQRPDGVVFVDDFHALGGTQALVELGAAVPGEVMVATHVNKGYALPYPVPVTRLQLDPHLVAREMVRMLKALLRGGSPRKRKVLVKPQLIPA